MERKLLITKKGFTLIELLVVVAIIGILAAVGVVAYNGYTSAAKKQATNSNHQTLIKYFSAELQKCNLGEEKFLEDSLNCSERFINYKISQTAESVLNSKFKNPYRTNQSMPQHGTLGMSCTQYVMGETKVENKNNILQIQTCISDTELLTHKISIE